MDISRYFALGLPEGDDSVASSAGLTQINNFFDAMDTELQAVSNTGVSPYYVGVWTPNTDQALAASGTPANCTFVYTNVFSTSGTPAPTFTTGTGMITFGTAGIYRLSWNFVLVNTVGVTEGYFRTGLKASAVAAYVGKTSKRVTVDIRDDITFCHNSILIEAAASGGDVDLVTNYNVTATHENNSASSATLRNNDSWVALEYVRTQT